MSIKYVNPYFFSEEGYKNGMDSVGNDLFPLYPNQTIDDLANSVYNYVIVNYAGVSLPALQTQSIKSIIYSIINGYINVQSGKYLLYNSSQMGVIQKLIEGTINSKNPEDIRQQIENIECQIISSELTSAEQMPLLYATSIGKASFDYWANIISKEGNPNWDIFIISFTPSIVKFPFWVASSIEGALLGLSYTHSSYNGKFIAELELVVNVLGVKTLLALLGSLSIGSGKVIFNLQQRDYSSSNCSC